MMSRPDLLIIDSYDQSRVALAALLRDSGYAVREARNGLEGLRAAREQVPGLVVVDLWPFFSASLQVIGRLRCWSADAEVPVLVVTSAVAPEYRLRALDAGCAAYLEKPCPADVVLSEVRRLLPPDGSLPVEEDPARLA